MRTDIRHAQSNREIFLAAVGIADEAERQAFLDRACGGDDEQHQRIERLLAAAATQPVNLLDRAVEQLGPDETCGGNVDTSLDFDISTHPTIDRYKLIEQIGEGGMGTVFMAQQTEPVKRMVALKLIKAGMDSREVISRFQAERQALAMMDHPNIASVLDAGTTDQRRPYFVMELVRGDSITQYCDQNSLSIDDRLRLFIDVSRAVQHAHQKGVIHRDLKPGNILVTLHDGKPVVKVIDFGLAKALHQELSEQTIFTNFSQIIGTPLYMSPEQVEMSGLNIDTRSDVYSLGVLLYELLTGTTPFDKAELSKAGFDGMRRIIREEEPPRPSHRVSTLEAQRLSTVAHQRQADRRHLALSMRHELDWIVMRALEKDRNRRYESASALAQDVQRYLEDAPVEACPPSTVYRLRKIARRYRGLVTTGCLLALAMLVASGLLWSERSRTLAALAGERDQRQIAETQEQTARQSAAEAMDQRNRALRSQYQAEIVSGKADWERGYLQRLNRKLMGHLPLDGQPDRRGWEWYYLWSLCHPEVRTLRSAVNSSYVAWSPDGEYVAASGDVWRAGTGELVRRLSMSNILRYRSAWSPDSRLFAWGMAADDSVIYVWDRQTDEIRELRGHRSSVWSVAWSPDGEQLASGGIGGEIHIWDIATGEVMRTFDAGNHVGSVGWSPDGELLAACVMEQYLQVWKSADGESLTRVKLDTWDTGNSSQLSWHPDGEQLAISTTRGWCLIKRRDWTTTHQFDLPLRRGRDVAWNPDGKMLALADGEAIVLWDPAKTQPERTLLGHSGRITKVDWSPDGQQLVSTDDAGEVKIWRLNVPLVPPVFSTGGPLESLSWRADNETLALVHRADSASSFWSAIEGQRLGVEPAVCDRRLWWSPDRRLVACEGDGDAETAEIQVRDADRDEVHAVWRGAVGETVANLAWSPDGKMLAIAKYSDSMKNVDMWDVDRELLVSTWRYDGPDVWPSAAWGSMTRLAWAPEATQLAITALGEHGDGGTPIWYGHVYVVNVATATTVLKHGMPHRANVNTVAWKPDGRALVAGTNDGLIEAVDVESGQRLFSTRLHSTNVNSLGWSPDGQRIVSAADDGSIHLLAAEDGADLLTFSLDDKATQVAWSPAGNRLAAATSSGQVHVWDAARADALSERGDRRGELAWSYYRARSNESLAEREARRREMLRLAPDTLEFWQARGEVRATLGDFEGATEEFAKAMSPGMRCSFDAMRAYGLTLLASGKIDAYREHCQAMLGEFADTQVPSSGGDISWLCTLVTNDHLDTETLVRLTRANLARNVEDGQLLAKLQLAAALYRHGLYQEAADRLTEVAERLERANDPKQRSVQADAHYFLAMARHQLGHRFQARRHLDEAARIADQLLEPSWRITVQHQVLASETRALVGP